MSNFPWEHLLIAEAGSVHDGSFGNAKKLIDAAAKSGAGAIKFQTHIAEAETLPNAPNPSYFQAEDRSTYFKRTGFTFEQWRELAAHAKERGLVFLSSPFSLEAVDLLEKLGMEAYKIPSGEVTNIPLLEHIAATGKPTLLSSGMSSWSELDAAVAVLRDVPLLVMQCSSAYPCPPDRVGLNLLQEMRARYGVPVGYSDHTLGFAAPVAAATLGAVVIEKHFTFSRMMYGSDAQHSMEPADFRVLADALDEVWRMLECPVDKSDVSAYGDMKRIFEKSIVTAQALPAGTTLTRSHLAFKKPGTGIPASRYRDVLGKVLTRHVPGDHMLGEEDFR